MVRDTLQVWYANDMGNATTTRQKALVMSALESLGPQYGYFSNCGSQDPVHARPPLPWRLTGRHGEVGGLDESPGGGLGAGGDAPHLDSGQIPAVQSAYAGFHFSLQMMWQYVSCITQGIVHYFEPLEEAIRLKFLPALLDVPPGYIGGEFRKMLSQSVRNDDIEVTNPVSTAASSFTTSTKGYVGR
ncbi:hypothetical protein ACHAWF_008967 [Thalassiosira exigua]